MIPFLRRHQTRSAILPGSNEAAERLTVPGPEQSEAHGDTDVLRKRGLHKQLSADNVLAVFINNDQLWQGTPQILGYWFLDGDLAGTKVQKQKIREAIDEWSWYANVEFREAISPAESNIRITFDPNDGSCASIGRQSARVAVTDATMNLAWLDKSNTSLTINERAVILHQFGHVLGLLHEHQSLAHGGVAIRNVQAAIDLYTRSQSWDTRQVYDRVINVYTMSDVSNFSQVDTTSIMHWPQPKELTGLPYDIPYNEKLSDLDKAYMILQYPRAKCTPELRQMDGASKRLLALWAPPTKSRSKFCISCNRIVTAQQGSSPL